MNEIKKALYKSKPKAIFSHADLEGMHYTSSIKLDGKIKALTFIIPYKEIDTRFDSMMEAQLLIRWLENYDSN